MNCQEMLALYCSV